MYKKRKKEMQLFFVWGWSRSCLSLTSEFRVFFSLDCCWLLFFWGGAVVGTTYVTILITSLLIN